MPKYMQILVTFSGPAEEGLEDYANIFAQDLIEKGLCKEFGITSNFVSAGYQTIALALLVKDNAGLSAYAEDIANAWDLKQC